MFRRRRLAQRPEPGFKDYYLILQVHPEADAAMIDAAYWHLARRYGEARLTDDSARGKMDDLNEAYSVLRHSERRDDFDRIRDALLGQKALPLAPAPPPEPVPLSVMERQRPRPREEAATATPAAQPARHRWPMPHLAIPGWQHYVSAAMFFALAVVALVWAQPFLVLGLFAVGVAVTLIPLATRGPAFVRRVNPRKPKSKSGPRGQRRRLVPRITLGHGAKATQSLQDSTQDARERLRQAPVPKPPLASADDRVAIQGQ
jgi:hypothetical protein